MRLYGPPERQRQQLARRAAALEERIDGLEGRIDELASSGGGESSPAVDAEEELELEATDAARDLAAESGLDLMDLAPGSGKEGRVLVGDVRDAIEED